MMKEIDKRETKVLLTKRSKLGFFIPAFAAPFIGFYLYDKWYMIYCTLLVLTIQLWMLFMLSTPEMEYKTITVSEMKHYVNSENRLDTLKRILFFILGILNIFPFLASNEAFMNAVRNNIPKYEGGLWVTFITLLLIGMWIYAAFSLSDPEINENYKLLKTKGLTVEEQNEANQKAKEEMEAAKQKKEEALYGIGFMPVGKDVVINDLNHKIFFKEKAYDYSDILAFDVKDNAITIHSASTSKAKTDTGNMIGRAVVGGMLFGNVGAAIGGATASKTIVNSESQSSVVHDYSIIITVNNISSPTEVIKIGQNEKTLNKIVSTLTVILNRNKTN